jgi:hypothetical protein
LIEQIIIRIFDSVLNTHTIFDYETDELISNYSPKEKFHSDRKTYFSKFYYRVIRYFERLAPSQIDYSSELSSEGRMNNVEKPQKEAGFFERFNRYLETLSVPDIDYYRYLSIKESK